MPYKLYSFVSKVKFLLSLSIFSELSMYRSQINFLLLLFWISLRFLKNCKSTTSTTIECTFGASVFFTISRMDSECRTNLHFINYIMICFFMPFVHVGFKVSEFPTSLYSFIIISWKKKSNYEFRNHNGNKMVPLVPCLGVATPRSPGKPPSGKRGREKRGRPNPSHRAPTPWYPSAVVPQPWYNQKFLSETMGLRKCVEFFMFESDIYL